MIKEIPVKRYVGAPEFARAVGLTRGAVQAAVRTGRLKPEAELIQQNRRPVALFSEELISIAKSDWAMPKGIRDRRKEKL